MFSEDGCTLLLMSIKKDPPVYLCVAISAQYLTASVVQVLGRGSREVSTGHDLVQLSRELKV